MAGLAPSRPEQEVTSSAGLACGTATRDGLARVVRTLGLWLQVASDALGLWLQVASDARAQPPPTAATSACIQCQMLSPR